MKTAYNKIQQYQFAIVTLILLMFSSCSRIEMPVNGGDSNALEIVADIPSLGVEVTKTTGSETSTIRAYPYNTGKTFPVSQMNPSRLQDNVYTFDIPQETEKIIFGNFYSENDTYPEGSFTYSINTDIEDPNTILEVKAHKMTYNEPINTDLYIGTISDYNSKDTRRTVQLKRQVAKVQFSLQLVIGADTVTIDNHFYSNYDINRDPHIYINNAYTSFNINTNNEIIFGNIEPVHFVFNSLSGKQWNSTTYYTLPSEEGTNAELELHLKPFSGNEYNNFRVTLPKRIEPNKSYQINMVLHKDPLTGSISMNDVYMYDHYLDGSEQNGDFDMIYLSSDLISFRNLSDGTKTLKVQSLMGIWNATIPSEVLNNFKITNTRTGEELSTSASGLDGDILAIEALYDNSTNKNHIHGEISFDAGTTEQYSVQLVQTNGRKHTIQFQTEWSRCFGIRGTDWIILEKSPTATTWDTISKYNGNPNYSIYDTNMEEDVVDIRIEAGYLSTLSIRLGQANSIEICDSLSLDKLYLWGSWNNSGTNTSISLNNAIIKHLNVTEVPSLTTFSITNSEVDTLVMNNLGITSLNLGTCTSPMMIDLSLTDIKTINIPNSSLLETITLNCRNLTRFALGSTDNIKYLNLSAGYSSGSYLNFESFASLEILKMSNLTKESIDMSAYTNLKDIHISNCSFTSIDMTACLNLNTIQINDCNNSLKKVNLLGCSLLENINIEKCWNINELYCSNLPNLKTFTIDRSSLTSLSLKGCSALQSLTLHGDYGSNLIKDLNLEDMPSLRYLTICGDDLETLAINNAENLTELSIENAKLTELIIPANNKLTSVSLVKLRQLDLARLQLNASSTLQSLFLSGISSLTPKSFSLKDYTKLQTIRVTHNLSSLDLSGCTSLLRANLASNTSLSSVNLSGCHNLTIVDLESSAITSLDITECNALCALDLMNTQLTANAINNIFNQMPLRTLEVPGEYRIIGSPGEATCDTKIAFDKYWDAVETDIYIVY